MPVGVLDTNAVSDLMRDHPKVKARAAAHPEPIISSAIVAGEIRHGLERLPQGKKRSELEAHAQAVFARIQVQPATEAIADIYGRLKAELERQGITLSDNDLWVAATTIAHGGLLVTRDKGFSQIPGLQVEDWSA
jgi:predicted nucleic acid-binding protein